ncbi:hypothetical protein NDN08_008191 [Rhodosorus marinus]|uniref:Dolichyl-phosphate-mannose--protein mannosyltransferase n=1 Tax=Rhodosorus marinus TaxID=101924 RepID=A0AAV8V4I3_9RHOD|nr:hypothetical protein NDN08_008191 [Rhodosorus marinus]
MSSSISESSSGIRQRRGVGARPAVLVADSEDDKTRDAKSKIGNNEGKVAYMPSVFERLPLDFYLECLVVLVAFVARMYRLGYPKKVVFDEFHFGKFVNWTIQRKYYFDIHPPLGKLILTAWGLFTGYEAVDGFMYDQIGKLYEDTLFFPMRELSAVLGSFVPLVAYRTCRMLNFVPPAALVPAFCVALDNLLVVESRLILLDSQLMFFCTLSMHCALVLWRTTKPNTARRWLWLFITGFVSGCALGIKWTSLAFPGVIAIISFFGLYFLEEPLTLLECVFALVSGLSIYALSFYVHFKILINSGPGDNFMETGFRHLLLGNQGYDATLKPPSFLKNFGYLNWRMFVSNKGILNTHHWSSVWYQWILNMRGVLFIREYDEQLPGRPYRVVYLFSNPAVTWTALLAIIIFLVTASLLARHRDMKFFSNRRQAYAEYVYTGAFCFFSWLSNLLPYILVDRSSFAYHYLPGLYFAEICIGLLVNTAPKQLHWLLALTIIGTIVAAYVYWAPWVYFLTLTGEQHETRRWLRGWD